MLYDILPDIAGADADELKVNIVKEVKRSEGLSYTIVQLANFNIVFSHFFDFLNYPPYPHLVYNQASTCMVSFQS